MANPQSQITTLNPYFVSRKSKSNLNQNLESVRGKRKEQRYQRKANGDKRIADLKPELKWQIPNHKFTTLNPYFVSRKSKSNLNQNLESVRGKRKEQRYQRKANGDKRIADLKPELKWQIPNHKSQR